MELSEVKQLPSVLRQFKDVPILILGGGSNLLFTDNFDGLVLAMRNKGIAIEEESDTEVLVKAAAGEVWHDLVMYATARGWGGIENLSLIPGTVGAAPIQNIGAYGVELKDVFHSLEAYLPHREIFTNFTAAQCQFAYRDSIFKRELKGKAIISSVTLRLQKQPLANISYGAIAETLQAHGIAPQNATIAQVSEAVIAIRKSKLPDPSVLGNAGSFFKNPEIDSVHFEKLKATFPELPGYPVSEDTVKVPAGWLIEQCGWKGRRVGETGAHAQQALVLVNYGGAHGKDILNLARQVQQSVEDRFGIAIVPEVNVVP
jgi:UDP-N-acetylmuramate dehydrogenase